MSIEELKARIAEIDALLGTDISDAEFDALEEEAARLTMELGLKQKELRFNAVPELKNANDWTRDFLASFENGTRVITNRQAECFHRINGGKPFKFENRRYECPGANYRAGFSHVVVTNI